MDSGEIDFAVLDVIEELYRCNKLGVLNPNATPTGREYVRADFMIQALFDLNIVYKSKYFDIMHLEHFLYNDLVLKEYIKNIRSTMSKKDKFGYWFYKKSKGVHWGSNFGGLPFYNTKEL